MNWRDLQEGDIVVPVDINASVWIVLHVGENVEGEHEMLYATLDIGAVYTTKHGADKFGSLVKVLRDGDNVNV